MGDPMSPPVPALPKPPQYEWLSKYRSRLFWAFLILLGLIAILYLQSDCFLSSRLFPPHKRTISAGDVTIVNEEGNKAEIRGSFTIKTDATNTNAIESYGTGGACLVAEWEKFGLSQPEGGCTTNKQCKDLAEARNKNWVGYCDTDGKDDDDGKCWLRPGGPEFCNRSIDQGNEPWADGEAHFTPKDGPYKLPGTPGQNADIIKKPIVWRVLACLNGVDPISGCETHCPMQVLGPKSQPVDHDLVVHFPP